MSGDNHRVNASPPPSAPQPLDPTPDAAPQGVGPWNMPLTVCPTPETAGPVSAGPGPRSARPAPQDGTLGDHPARPAFEDGSLAGESPQLTGPSGEGSSQGSRKGWKGLATPLGILAAVAGAFAYVGTVDPNEPGHYPVCPLLQLTGAFCPGCGGLRSAHAFVHGDLGAAFSANAVATTGYFLFAAVWVLWLVRAWRGQPLRIRLAPAWWWGIGTLLLAFTVVRNLPFGSALAP
ncbi:uncharacterized protein DUF2752 [Streptomyces cavourensis]|nr:uncharacterized protein DUF2752 [Streptomyces cavourensis]GGU79572.1 hypothetical protein GCM10010498_41950 [Streptomyces cavourensis]